MKIVQIKEKQKGWGIDKVEGIITGVKKEKKKQSAMIEDDSGSVYISFWDCQDLTEGQFYNITPSRAGNEFKGLKVWSIGKGSFISVDKDAVIKEGESTIENGSVTKTGGSINNADRSMALSYAKDLVIAGKLPEEWILEKAEKYAKYIATGETGKVEQDPNIDEPQAEEISF